MTQDSTQANSERGPAAVDGLRDGPDRPTPLATIEDDSRPAASRGAKREAGVGLQGKRPDASPTAYPHRPWLLDVFCGAGGASMGYHRAGFHVVGVDIKPQPNYPFAFHQADAIEFLSELISIGPAHYQFAAIHASPPCQHASKAKVLWDNIHPDLLEPTRELLEASGLPYVIENVKGAALRDPVVLEGQMFGLNTHRPRLFETNWPLEVPILRLTPGPMAKMGRPIRRGESVQVIGHFSDVNAGREAMGIDWMSRDEMSEAIPPAYTEFIAGQLVQYLALETEMIGLDGEEIG